MQFEVDFHLKLLSVGTSQVRSTLAKIAKALTSDFDVFVPITAPLGPGDIRVVFQPDVSGSTDNLSSFTQLMILSDKDVDVEFTATDGDALEHTWTERLVGGQFIYKSSSRVYDEDFITNPGAGVAFRPDSSGGPNSTINKIRVYNPGTEEAFLRIFIAGDA